MILSSRVKSTVDSVTLKVNERVSELTEEGKHIYNLTAGQLPFKPLSAFTESIKKQVNFLKSYQYAPVAGFSKLREKFLHEYSRKREIDLSDPEINFDCVISNGSKHSIYNVLGALINPGDEVIILTPYWVSYPEMIKFWSGIPIVVQSHAYDAYNPDIDDIRKVITPRTKALILNSPNNPAGIHYSEKWMKEFALFLKEHPNLIVLSDELYSEIYYFDPRPTYYYQFDSELLKQTVIISGISKSFASTGLRIGYAIGDKKLINAISKLQGQTTSGANSLIQRALIDFDFLELDHFFDNVKTSLRTCAHILREEFRQASLPHAWYQTSSGFYYLLDFSRTPYFESKYQWTEEDYAEEICSEILEKTGVALVPGSAFGYKNSARLSLVLEPAPFEEAIKRLVAFLAKKVS